MMAQPSLLAGQSDLALKPGLALKTVKVGLVLVGKPSARLKILTAVLVGNVFADNFD